MDSRENLNPADWMTSADARKALRISFCDLMHLRDSDQLRFIRMKGGFFYKRSDVNREFEKKNKSKG